MMNFTKKKFFQLLACAFIAPFTGSISKAVAQPLSTLTVGTGTYTQSYLPLYTCYGYSYTQQIYTAADIIAANGGTLPATNTITKLRFKTTTGSTTTTASSNGWTVYMANTSVNNFAGTTSWIPYSALTQVFTGTVTFPTPGNWLEVALPTSFIWDGTSNIVVAVDENVAGYNCTVSFSATTVSDNKGIYYYNDNINPDPVTPPTAYGVTVNRANVQFDFVVPNDNTGVDSVYTLNNSFCSGAQDVYARVHNYGGNVVNPVNVNWSVDGALQTPVAITTTINMENTVDGPYASVLLGSYNFPYNTAKVVKSWTSMPNGVADTKPANDSTTKSLTANLLGITDFLIAPQDTTICTGSVLTLDAGEHPKGPIFIWNNGQISQSINVTNAGSYGVKVQNTDGCVAYDTVTVSVHPNPLVNSIAIIDNTSGSYTFNVIGAQNIIDYTWDFGDGNTQSGSGIPGQIIHQYTASGNYTVTLTLSNDCGSIAVTRLVSTTGPSAPTGIDNVSALQQAISIAPNPSKTKTLITATADVKMKSLVVYNVVGQKVFVQEKVNASKAEINVASFATGVYNVIIDTDKGEITKKLEVLR